MNSQNQQQFSVVGAPVRSLEYALRSHFRRYFCAVLLLLLACRAPQAEIQASAALRDLWFDQFAAPDGDGSREKPFKSISVQSLTDAHLFFKTGMYRGPLQCQRCIIEGVGANAVIFSELTPATLTIEASELKNLTVQGGQTALDISGGSTLDQVAVSGFRQTGIDLKPQARLLAARVVLQSSVADTIGLRVRNAQATVADSTLSGPMKRALTVDQGQLTVRQVHISGATVAVHSIDADTKLHQVEIAGGRGPAIFAARGLMELKTVQVTGHEYGVQTGVGTRLEVDGFTSRNAQVMGLALVENSGSLKKIVVEHAGGGAMSMLNSTMSIEGLTLNDNQDTALFIHKGRVTLKQVTIKGVASTGQGSDGDAIVIRDATVESGGLLVEQTAGIALNVSAFSRVMVKSLTSRDAAHGALMAERESEVSVDELFVQQSSGPAVAALGGGRIDVQRIQSVTAIDPLVWAECQSGAVIRVGQVEGASVTPSPCVTLDPRLKTPAISR